MLVAPKELPVQIDLSKESPIVAGLVIVFLIISLGLHELAHAWVAWKCGDSTAKNQGRISLNPIRHIDPFMTILLPAVLIWVGSPFLFGGAKPVPVVTSNLRKPARDMMLVAIAGPLTNLLLAVVFLLVWKILVYLEIYEYGSSRNRDFLPLVLGASMYFNLLLAIFNMLPIPPLDGSRVVSYFMPESVRRAYLRFEFVGMALLLFLVVQGHLRPIIRDTMAPLKDFVHIITGGDWR